MLPNEDILQTYLTDLRKEPNAYLEQLSNDARLRGVPIMQPETMATVEQLIRLYQPRSILEIGTAVGYSAINMVLASDNRAHVTTIERESKMVEEATQHIQALSLASLITVIERDALDSPETLLRSEPFDLIFIDAGKGHYQTFFDLYTPFLSKRGVVIHDNVLLRGYVLDPEKAPKRFKKMAQKMRAFNEWLNNHPDYQTVLLPIGDGLSISIKK